MHIPIAQIEWRGFRVPGITPDHVMRLGPEPGYEHGRKALAMSGYWAQARAAGAHGVLWLDPDIAADPDDLAAMTRAITGDPALMYTGLVKLWPASTERDTWIWSHRGGTIGKPAATQQWDTPVTYVSQGILWTPRRLLDLAFPAHSDWQWVQVDVGLSELALTHGIGAMLVPGCRPKHLHFSGEHNRLMNGASDDPPAGLGRPGSTGDPVLP